MIALAQAEHLISQAIDELEHAKEEVGSEAHEPLVFLRAELKVARRRLQNLRRSLGDSSEPGAAA